MGRAFGAKIVRGDLGEVFENSFGVKNKMAAAAAAVSSLSDEILSVLGLLFYYRSNQYFKTIKFTSS